MKKHPILFLILYLIEKGCCWEKSNEKGDTASEIFIANGYKKNVVDLIDKFAADKKKTSGRVAPVCMGQQGKCQQPPNFTLSCPHKGIYTTCTKCFLSTIDKVKCGCPDETIIPITIEKSSTIQEESDSDDESSSDEENSTENEEDGSSIEEEEVVEDEEDLSSYKFTLIEDGTKFGYVKDQLGNKYSCFKSTRKPGYFETSYRCGAFADGCPSVAQRIVYKISGQVKFLLDSAHRHPEEKRKRVSISSSSSSGNPFSGY